MKKRHAIQQVPIEEMIYAKSADYSELTLKGSGKELPDMSLEKLEQLLSPSFMRTHKSYLVKMTNVKETKVSSGSRYHALLKNEESLPMG